MNQEELEKSICADLITYPENVPLATRHVNEEDFMFYRSLFNASINHPGNIPKIMNDANLSSDDFNDLARMPHFNVEQNAIELKELNEKRSLKKSLEAALTETEKGEAAASDIYARIKKPISEVTDYQPIPMDAESFLQRMEQRRDQGIYETGIRSLDIALNGGLSEGLYVLSAVPCLGKTAIVMQILDHVAAAGHDALMLSYEMPRDELISRSIARIIKDDGMKPDPNGMKIFLGKMSDAELDTVWSAAIEYEKQIAPHMFIHDCDKRIDVDGICNIIKYHIAKRGTPPVTAIDYLQIIAGRDARQSEMTTASEIVTTLKALSRETHTPIILISSIARSDYTQIPTLASFKHAGQIEYSADAAFVLYYTEQETDTNFDPASSHADLSRVTLKIVKNRRNPERNYEKILRLHMDRTHGLFREIVQNQ